MDVLRLTEKGEPGRSARSGLWPVMFSQNPAHHVLVDVHAKGQRNLLGNSRLAQLVAVGRASYSQRAAGNSRFIRPLIRNADYPSEA